MITPRWHIYPDSKDLCERATSAITRVANHAIIKRGVFHLVLAGGSTPKIVYQQLRNAPTEWSAWHIYFGDERCLPADDVERNSVMAFDALLHHVPIPARQIHVIQAEHEHLNAQYTRLEHMLQELKESFRQFLAKLN